MMRMLNRRYANGPGGIKCFCCGPDERAKGKERNEERREIRDGLNEARDEEIICEFRTGPEVAGG